MKYRFGKWIGTAVLTALLAVSGAAPVLSLCALAEDELVIEVIEDIPAEELELIEDSEVPLAMAPVRTSAGSAVPFAILAAGSAAIGVFFAVRSLKWKELLKIRKEGYLEEEQRLKEKRDRKD